MEQMNVVLYQNDAGTALALAANLSQHFPSINLANSQEEIRTVIARCRADVLVLDVEASDSGEVERLHREFPDVSIVCTHRLADDELWAEALNQGAVDLCVPWNVDDIVRSVVRNRSRCAAA